jgi:hypothetical protein
VGQLLGTLGVVMAVTDEVGEVGRGEVVGGRQDRDAGGAEVFVQPRVQVAGLAAKDRACSCRSS